MTCARCGGSIPPDLVVTVNGRNVHPLVCFAEELRSLKHAIADVAIELAAAMEPMQAYRLGQTYVAVIVAERRKAKKR